MIETSGHFSLEPGTSAPQPQKISLETLTGIVLMTETYEKIN